MHSYSENGRSQELHVEFEEMRWISQLKLLMSTHFNLVLVTSSQRKNRDRETDAM